MHLIHCSFFLIVSSILVACTGDPKVFKPLKKIEFSEQQLFIAKKYAPILYQAAGSRPKFDAITRFDFDGDFDGDNNWENARNKDFKSYVYYSVIETKAYFYIFYGFYHPRDYEPFCLPVFCHENDLEGITVMVKKATDTEAEHIFLFETEAHDRIYSYKPNLKEHVSKMEPRLSVYSEEEGHGVYAVEGHKYAFRQACDASKSSDAGFSKGHNQSLEDITNKPHLVFVPGEIAESTKGRSSGVFKYELIPLTDIWNNIGEKDHQRLGQFPFNYKGRIFSLNNLPSAFYGNNFSLWKLGTAKPPWAWPDRSCYATGVGDWFFDPAFSMREHLGQKLQEEDEYLFNPYRDAAK